MGTSLITQKEMQSVLDWAYDRSINGGVKLKTAQELAESYLYKSENVHKAANLLVKWQARKASGVGFVTGLGGLATLPITIPADFASVLFINIRMAAAIAYMGGYDLHNDKVKTFVFLSLIGNSVKEVIRDTSIEVGKRVTKSLIEKIPGETLKAINKKLGSRIITKFGEKSAITLGKFIPVVGGLLGGGIDFFSTRTIGKKAISIFIENKL